MAKDLKHPSSRFSRVETETGHTRSRPVFPCLLEDELIKACLAYLAFAMAVAAGESTPAPASAANEPSTAAEAKMQVERMKQEIAQEEKTWSEEVAREKDAESRRRQRFSEFSQDRIRLQQTLAEQEEKLKATLAKMETHQYRDRELQSRFKQLGQALAARAKELRAAMAKSLPYRLDKRLEALDLLIRDVEGGNISPEEAMNRLWTIDQNERRLAQEAEVYSGDFSDDAGDPIQVKYLRVGKQVLAFSSMDGSKLGIMRRDSAGYGWFREKDMDRDMRQALKQAVATAEGKSVPGFVPLPVWKNSFIEPVAMSAQVAASETQASVPPAPALPAAKAKAKTKPKGAAK
jgi:hypothetical protein